MTIHAFTELHSDYPAFVNLTEKPDGSIALTVRSRGNGGSDVASINLTKDQLLDLVHDATNFILQKLVSKPTPAAEETITFDAFVQHGREQCQAMDRPLNNGMPWSFSYKGHAVTHENDQLYLIARPGTPESLRFTPDQVLVTGADGTLSVRSA